MKVPQKRITTLALAAILTLTVTPRAQAMDNSTLALGTAAMGAAWGLILYVATKTYRAPKPIIKQDQDQEPAQEAESKEEVKQKVKEFLIKANQAGTVHLNVKQNEKFKLVLEKTGTITEHYLTSDFSSGLAEMEAVGQDHPEKTTYYVVARRPGITTCYSEKHLRSAQNPKQLCRLTGCDITLHIE